MKTKYIIRALNIWVAATAIGAYLIFIKIVLDTPKVFSAWSIP